jgi:hypothetical protein
MSADSFSVLFAHKVAANIGHLFASPVHETLAISLALFPLAVIGVSTFKSPFTDSMKFVVVPLALIKFISGIGTLPIAVSHALSEVAFVDITAEEASLSFSVELTLGPVSSVGPTLRPSDGAITILNFRS